MSAYPQLVCCGGSPSVCQIYNNAAICPMGTNPQFCCNSKGLLTAPLITLDTDGNNVTTCPNQGDIPYSRYDPTYCQQTPVYNCCNNGQCYQSKDPNCNLYNSAMIGVGGMVVSDCSQCFPGSTVNCCFPEYNICEVNDAATGCSDFATKVSDCNQCYQSNNY